MADKFFQNAEKQIIKNRNKKRWKRVVKILSMVVVFCTTYALILPAITLESSCQLTEHTHQDSCYKKVVSQEDTNTERKLICGQHEHSEECWEEEKVLICGKEEVEEVPAGSEGTEIESESEKNDGEEKAVEKTETHRHDDGCYSVEKKLVCGYDSDHKHSDGCYELETKEEPLTCTNTDADHVHTERCYGTWELVCGMEEHVHDKTCNIDLNEEETEEDTMALAEDAGVFTWEDNENGLSVTLTLTNSSYTNTEYELKVEKKDKENYQNALNTFTKHGQEIEEAAIYKISLRRKDTAQEFTSLNCSYTVQFSWASGVFTEVTEEDYLDFAYCVNSNSDPTTWTESKYSANYDATGNVLFFQGSSDWYPSSGEFLFVRSYAPNGLKAGNNTLTYNTVKDAFIKDAKYSDYYNANSPIGTAGSFHLVAFDTATLGTHTNGNVLAKNLVAKSNFGTNNYSKELSYVQNYETVAATSAANANHILVVGSSNTFGYEDNGNAFSINGTKMDKPNNFVQDKDTAQAPFINLARVEREVGQIASNLNSYKDADITFRKENSYTVLQLEKASGVGVYHCKATEIGQFNGYVRIDGFTSGKNGTVVVNVDCTGVTEINMPKAKIVIDGQEQGTSEVIEFSAGKVIWNFVNASGVKINTTEMTGIILAPGADVHIGSNLNGTVVADNIHVGAESHRTDFTGKVTEPEEDTDNEEEEYYITVHKIETGYAGTALAGAEFDLYQWIDNNWTKVNVETLVTTGNGTVALRKLQSSVAYKLVETKAPAGYKLKDGAFCFWVRTDKDQTVPNEKPEDFVGTAVEVGGTLLAANDKQEDEEKEDTDYILPETGGYGTASYTVAGLCIVLLSGTAFICNNKKRKCKK